MTPPPFKQIFYRVVDHKGESYKGHTVNDVWLYPEDSVEQIISHAYRQDKTIPWLKIHVFKDMTSLVEGTRIPWTSPVNDLRPSDKTPVMLSIPLPYEDNPNAKVRNLDLPDAVFDILKGLAWRLFDFYEFEYDETDGPVIGDVFRAKEGTEGHEWDFRRYEQDGLDIRFDTMDLPVKRGDTLAMIPLPNVYSTKDWEFIQDMESAARGLKSPVTLTPRNVLRLDGMIQAPL